jgi:hypothetical protein
MLIRKATMQIYPPPVLEEGEVVLEQSVPLSVLSASSSSFSPPRTLYCALFKVMNVIWYPFYFGFMEKVMNYLECESTTMEALKELGRVFDEYGICTGTPRSWWLWSPFDLLRKLLKGSRSLDHIEKLVTVTGIQGRKMALDAVSLELDCLLDSLEEVFEEGKLHPASAAQKLTTATALSTVLDQFGYETMHPCKSNIPDADDTSGLEPSRSSSRNEPRSFSSSGFPIPGCSSSGEICSACLDRVLLSALFLFFSFYFLARVDVFVFLSLSLFFLFRFSAKRNLALAAVLMAFYPMYYDLAMSPDHHVSSEHDGGEEHLVLTNVVVKSSHHELFQDWKSIVPFFLKDAAKCSHAEFRQPRDESVRHCRHVRDLVLTFPDFRPLVHFAKDMMHLAFFEEFTKFFESEGCVLEFTFQGAEKLSP